ncbi:unnamed protein product [Mesocestoides corti]|uniref:Kinesin motor domain-containing protein n=1 Tax=Mesocestoides corti TaxID=53468 RepID=A0A0R3UR05_MESCO|nr:unnamed protein product [Mesocestoides corti]
MKLELEEEAPATPSDVPSLPSTTVPTSSNTPASRPSYSNVPFTTVPAGGGVLGTIARLRVRLEEQEELLRTTCMEAETSFTDMAQLQAECQPSREEANYILQALEAELAACDREIEEIKEHLAQKSLLINVNESEVQLARDALAAQSKKYAEIVGTLIHDVYDIGECMSSQLQKPNTGNGERIETDVTVMYLYMIKMITEAKMLHLRVNQLEEGRVRNVQLLRRSKDEYAIRVRGLVVNVKSLTEKVGDSDYRIQQLQNMVNKA